MAKIPLYNRTQSLTTQAPDIEKNAASFGAVSGAQAQLGGTIAQAGAQVADTANKIFDGMQTVEKSKLQAEAIKQMTQLQLENENDRDYATKQERYTEKYKQMQNNLLKNTNLIGMNRDLFEAELSSDISTEMAKVTRSAQKEAWAVGRANLETNINDWSNQASLASTQGEKQKYFDKAMTAIAEQERVGSIGVEIAAKARIDTKHSFELDAAKVQAVVNPDQFLVDADDPDGPYQNLGDKRVPLKIEARKQLFLKEIDAPDANFKTIKKDYLSDNKMQLSILEIEAMSKYIKAKESEVQLNTKNELSILEREKKLTKDVIKAKEDLGHLTPDEGEAFRKSLRTAQGLTSKKEYTVSLNEAMARASKIGPWYNLSDEDKANRFREYSKIYVNVLNNKSNLSDKDYQKSLTSIAGKMDDFKPYADGILNIASFSEAYKLPSERMNIKKELQDSFITKVDNGVDPVQAYKDSIAERMSKEVGVAGSIMSTPTVKPQNYSKAKLLGIAKKLKIDYSSLLLSLAKQDNTTLEDLEKRIK